MGPSNKGEKLVEDILFINTQHVFDEIRNMNVKGGSPFGRAAAWAFKLATEQNSYQSYDDLKVSFEKIASILIELKPTMATIHNVNSLVLNFIQENQHEDVLSLSQKVSHLCEKIINYSFSSVERLAEYGANLIYSKPDCTILMHSYTSSLMSIFEKAKGKGSSFEVICTESRPLRESRVAIKKLKELGVSVRLIIDASVCEYLPKVDMVLVGADSITWHGDIANKIGTKMIAKLAASYQVPVYVASEILKIDKRTLHGYIVKLEKRDRSEVVDNTPFEHIPDLQVENQFFDLTPCSLIQAIICEEGLLPPSQVGQYWEKIEKSLKEG